MVDSEPITCVLCAEEATPKVVKDSGYNAMMVLLWEAVQVDVKFTENIKFELCAPCFNKAASFYDLNDAAVIMEKRIKTLTKDLLKKNLQGISKHKEKKKGTLPLHAKITEIYGTELEEDDIDVNYDYEFEAQLLDPSGKVLRKSSQSGGSKPKQSTKVTNETLRETVVTVSDMLDDETSETMTTASASSTRCSTKRGQGQATKKQGGKRKRGVKRKTRKANMEDTSEDEEDVYTSSESESEGSNWSDEASTVPQMPATHSDDETVRLEQDNGDGKQNSDVESEEESDKNDSPSNSVESQSKRSKYECGVCLEVYPNEQAYEVHYRRHTIKEGEGFQCRCCRETFVKKQELCDHLKLHGEGKYPCPVCKVMCNTETKIIQHLQTVHKNYWNRVPKVITA